MVWDDNPEKLLPTVMPDTVIVWLNLYNQGQNYGKCQVSKKLIMINNNQTQYYKHI